MDMQTKLGKAFEGQLRVWWIPQVGMDNTFYQLVPDLKMAVMLINVLGNYDQFQLDNGIKPDYCNVGGLEVFEDGEWIQWEQDGYVDPEEYLDYLAESGLLEV